MTEAEIWEMLEEVNDPEVPVLSVVDLGVVREVRLNGENCTITITPTYSGCPAMQVIEEDIRAKFREHDLKEPEIRTVLSPAWTTDWLSEKGKQKLEAYGIAPPANEVDKSTLFSAPPVIRCPHCKSTNTRMVSQFGSTPCKAHYQCNDCLEPFDYFKCLK